MNQFTFIPLGVGDAFSAKYYSSCLLVKAERTALLVDCPHPIRKMLHEGSRKSGLIDLSHIDAVVLTHLHADHASGIEGYAFYSKYILGRRARIITHPEVSKQLWNGHLCGSMQHVQDIEGNMIETRSMEDFIELEDLSESSALAVGPFQIECRKTIHHIPTTAVRISSYGRSLAYSADTSFDPSLIDWLGKSDLIVHETNKGDHTPFDKLLSIDEATQRKMKLIHYSDDFEIDQSPIDTLKQGVEYSV